MPKMKHGKRHLAALRNIQAFNAKRKSLNREKRATPSSPTVHEGEVSQMTVETSIWMVTLTHVGISLPDTSSSNPIAEEKSECTQPSVNIQRSTENSNPTGDPRVNIQRSTENSNPTGDPRVNIQRSTENSNPTGEPQPPAPKRSRKQTSELIPSINETKDLNRVCCNPRYVDDECEAFGRHVAVQLQQLPVTQRIYAQDEVQKILTRYRLAAIKANPVTSSTPPPVTDCVYSDITICKEEVDI